MSSPTISLALIVKNEEKNLNRLLDSVEGCFDEIVLVDTGSQDKTKEIAIKRGCRVFDFEWVNDFSKARNHAFSKCRMDFIMWLDADDVLHNKEGFLAWKQNVMQFQDCFFVTYNYALNKDGLPVISFVRERVFRRSIEPTWQYPLHEGIIIKPEWSREFVVSWAVNHMRDMEDMAADKSRNISILETLKKQGSFDARLQFYYGKELFEDKRPSEAVVAFENAIARKDIEMHDKILAYQYAGYASQGVGDMIKDDLRDEKFKWYDKCIAFAMDGIKLDSARAEFFVMAGDCYIKKGLLIQALPLYAAAKNCINATQNGPYQGPIFSFRECYGEMPSIQMAKIYFHLGRMDESLKEAKECVEKYNNPEAKKMVEELDRIRPLITLDNGQIDCDDIVFTCPPQSAYEFDEVIYQTKPLGGSETALVQMAKELKEKTGRPVKVFNMRQDILVAPSGVEYLPASKVNEYMSVNKPKVHIAWRHNIQVTKGKTYLWCHDLVTQTVEMKQNFDKIMCLSPFHKDYVMGKQGLKAEQVWVTRNGITPEKFNFDRPKKNPNKILFMSSPDRGLDRSIEVVELMRKEFSDLELHCYYGFENLYKSGVPQWIQLADKIKAMIAERPWVKMHGFTEQNQMYREVSDAVIWMHPCTFIETYCITALEMLALGVFPITRKLGALRDTLKDAEEKRQAIVLDSENLQDYAKAGIRVLLNRQWENVSFDLDANSWSKVADSWIEEMDLGNRQ